MKPESLAIVLETIGSLARIRRQPDSEIVIESCERGARELRAGTYDAEGLGLLSEFTIEHFLPALFNLQLRISERLPETLDDHGGEMLSPID